MDHWPYKQLLRSKLDTVHDSQYLKNQVVRRRYNKQLQRGPMGHSDPTARTHNHADSTV
jgi:hypothetical protein